MEDTRIGFYREADAFDRIQSHIILAIFLVASAAFATLSGTTGAQMKQMLMNIRSGL